MKVEIKGSIPSITTECKAVTIIRNGFFVLVREDRLLTMEAVRA